MSHLVASLLSCLLTLGRTSPSAFEHVVSVAGNRQDTIKIEAWGSNSLRVRVRFGGGTIDENIPGALIPQTTSTESTPVILTDKTVTNGNLRAEVGPDGLLQFVRVSDGQILLSEIQRDHADDLTARSAFATEWNITNYTDGIYGFGEHQQGKLNMKGTGFDFESCLDYGHSHGGEVCLPFILGSREPVAGVQCTIEPSVGCYSDSERRLLPSQGMPVNQNDLTIEKCARECYGISDLNTILGVESGTQCYCGNKIPKPRRKANDTDCNNTCSGDSSENCGGPWHARLHSFTCSAQPQPSPPPGGHSGLGLQYAFLWNMPNYGRVDFEPHTTNWTALSAAQIDFWVSATPGGAASQAAMHMALMKQYADAVGHAPMLPESVAGYWHSRNRYSSQASNPIPSLSCLTNFPKYDHDCM